MQDLVAGHIDMMIDAPVTILPQLPTARSRPLPCWRRAVWLRHRTSHRRRGRTARLPCLDWLGFWVPKGTPRDIIGMLSAAAITQPGRANRPPELADLGYQVPPREQQTPEALGALQRAEIAKWLPIIKSAASKAIERNRSYEAPCSKQPHEVGSTDERCARLRFGSRRPRNRTAAVSGQIIADVSRRLIRECGIGPGMRVLDIGCGVGDMSMLLAEIVGAPAASSHSTANPSRSRLRRPGRLRPDIDRSIHGCLGRGVS